ncbi:YceD family protein [Magnetococcus sp. PR-3]|uniref:YceD family protein n=1 Tax=Magnetococcus sp. PR-3 TaxID=3120355 RepID=UPI002FCE2622
MDKDISHIKLPLSAAGHHPRNYEGIIPADQLEGLQNSEETSLVNSANCAVTAQMQQGKLHVTGTVSSTVQVVCSRCLKSFDQQLEGQVDRWYATGEDPHNGSSGELALTDELVYLEDDLFTLPPLVDEELMLHLPMLPLCSEGCKGICAQCGANLNESACRCDGIPSDSPFAALKQLKLK